jgi:uncharacterized protein YehS (DUF1456 family)
LSALGRVTHVRGKEEYVAFAKLHALEAATILDEKMRVALQLVEELLQRIIVKVAALVGAPDDGDDEIGVRPNLLIAHGRP